VNDLVVGRADDGKRKDDVQRHLRNRLLVAWWAYQDIQVITVQTDNDGIENAIPSADSRNHRKVDVNLCGGACASFGSRALSIRVQIERRASRRSRLGSAGCIASADGGPPTESKYRSSNGSIPSPLVNRPRQLERLHELGPPGRIVRMLRGLFITGLLGSVALAVRRLESSTTGSRRSPTPRLKLWERHCAAPYSRNVGFLAANACSKG